MLVFFSCGGCVLERRYRLGMGIFCMFDDVCTHAEHLYHLSNKKKPTYLDHQEDA